MMACWIWAVSTLVAFLLLCLVCFAGCVVAARSMKDPAGIDDLGRKRVGR